MPLAPADCFDRLDDALCALLRERIRAACYDDSILAWGESIAPGAPDAVRLPVVHWHLRRRCDPAARMAMLFAYDGQIVREDAEKLLTSPLFDSFLRTGILEVEAGQVRASVRILPVDNLYVIGDIPTRGTDAVMPPGPTTLQLLRLLPDRLHGAMLDIGCGSGIFAMAARQRGAHRATGVDISARAIAAARACRRLNDIDCEFRIGDLTAPVAGESFDLVVAQPPYVVRPPEAQGITFLHGGADGDEIALRLMREIPRVLLPGGQALVLFDAPVREGEPLHARVRAALGDAPVDVAIIAARGLSPDLQACGYASLEAPGLGAEYIDLVELYRSHLASLGFESISHALVLLRALPEGTSPGITVTLPVDRLPRGSSVVADLWRSLDLASQADEALSAASVRVSPHARWVQERVSPGHQSTPAYLVQFPEGSLGSTQQISEAAAALFEALDESASVSEAITRYAQLCEAAPGEVAGQVVNFVREGLARALLVPG